MENQDIVLVGASAGGVEALSKFCSRLPADLSASVLVVQHTSPSGPSLMARLLGRVSMLPVSAAVDGEPLLPGHIYVSVPDRHLLLRRGRILVRRGPHENHTRPAVDALFRSAAVAYGSRVIGVVLTGALDDGTDGLIAIKRGGGTCVVQSPDDAAWPSMPLNALRRDHVDHSLPLDQLPELIVRLTRQRAGPSHPLSEAMQIEDRIASEESPMLTPELSPPGVPSALSCPECGGVLNEIADAGTLRFRCQIGHAYTSQGLGRAQSEEIEHGMQVAIRTHRERLALFLRMQASAEGQGHVHAAQRWATAATEAERLMQAMERTLELLAADPVNRGEVLPADS
jgi:two-component system chemotaxis response regulator CheB